MQFDRLILHPHFPVKRISFLSTGYLRLLLVVSSWAVFHSHPLVSLSMYSVSTIMDGECFSFPLLQVCILQHIHELCHVLCILQLSMATSREGSTRHLHLEHGLMSSSTSGAEECCGAESMTYVSREHVAFLLFTFNSLLRCQLASLTSKKSTNYHFRRRNQSVLSFISITELEMKLLLYMRVKPQ